MDANSTTASASSELLIGLLVLLAGIGIVWLIAFLRWNKLGKELFPNGVGGYAGAQAAPKTIGIRSGLASRLIERSLHLLDGDASPTAATAARALRSVGAMPGTTKAMDDLIAKSLETAEVRSVLLGTGGLYTYMLVVPNRHDHSHLLRRHAPFSGGWRQHAEVLRKALSTAEESPGGQFKGMASLLLFLSPEGEESRLQISCADQTSMLIPLSLAEAEDAKVEGVKTSDLAMDFKLAA
jgi:hypothetical protein